MLDFLYEKKARALATYKLAKEESDKIYAQWVWEALDNTILFLVDEPCMQWPL